jgi:hypothetical protein
MVATVLSLIFALIGLWGLFQTEMVITWFARPGGIEKIRLEMEADRAVQVNHNNEYCALTGKNTQEGIVIHNLFVGSHKTYLEEAKKSLLSNDELRAALEEKFGVNLQQLNAVVIPAWHIREPNEEQLGLMPRARKGCKFAVNDPSYDGFTIRDRVGAPKLTTDGRPRIVLNADAFNSYARLRRALLHEALHALNVPKYEPYRSTRTDLTYLKEYREVVELVDKYDRRQERLIWAFFVILPFTLCLIALIAARNAAPWRETTAA